MIANRDQHLFEFLYTSEGAGECNYAAVIRDFYAYLVEQGLILISKRNFTKKLLLSKRGN